MKMVKDNKGMSLVEVIIAITILGVVVVPVLNSLTTAMVYNAKARKSQKLTITAESIMETFKSESLETLKNNVFKSGGTQISGVTNGTYSTVSEKHDGTGDEYVFSITDFDEGGEKYNAQITVTGTVSEDAYEADNVNTLNRAVFKSEETNTETAVNNKICDLYSTDGIYKNVYSAIITKPDASNFESDHEGNSDYNFVKLKIYPDGSTDGVELTDEENLNTDYAKKYITINDRTLTFDVTKDGDLYKVTAKIVYHYSLKDFPYNVVRTPKVQSGLTYEGESHEEEYTNYMTYPTTDGKFLEYELPLATNEYYSSEEPLERLYIYYYPQYDATENIVINVNADVDFDCYLVKQKATDMNITRLKNVESGYSPNVTLSTPLGKTVKLYHNMDINLADGSALTGTHITTSGFANVLELSSGMNLEKEKLSYHISLVITDSAGKTVSTLESSMNEKISSAGH